ncbi:unnamed protein product [Pseudo-nitzschia multistriata]|uniref:Uncharacterized protein n=1 Tax=Pseudo-nitzschia multistriata TaxID=183589 RepID=A0A448ZCG3_9STRA|nr:unnamed protein product [Pseudo-nitzschia multistriata]
MDTPVPTSEPTAFSSSDLTTELSSDDAPKAPKPTLTDVLEDVPLPNATPVAPPTVAPVPVPIPVPTNPPVPPPTVVPIPVPVPTNAPIPLPVPTAAPIPLPVPTNAPIAVIPDTPPPAPQVLVDVEVTEPPTHTSSTFDDVEVTEPPTHTSSMFDDDDDDDAVIDDDDAMIDDDDAMIDDDDAMIDDDDALLDDDDDDDDDDDAQKDDDLNFDDDDDDDAVELDDDSALGKNSLPGSTMTYQGVRGEWEFSGIQSDWGPAHAGSMVYDFTRNSVYLVGSYFPDSENDWVRSGCFLGEIPMSDIKDWKTVESPLPPSAKNRLPSNHYDGVEVFSLPDSLDPREVLSCHSIMYDDRDDSNHYLFIGAVDEPDAQIRSGTINGFVNAFQRSSTNPDWELKINPTALDTAKAEDFRDTSPVPVRYPIAMTTGFYQNQEHLMVVSVSSNDPLLTEEYVESGDANNAQNFKNTMVPPGLRPYNSFAKRGSNYFYSHQFFTYDKRKNDMELTFSFDAILDSDETYPTGVVNLVPNNMIAVMVGHLKGRGPRVFRFPKPLMNGVERLDDFDGFVQNFLFANGVQPQFRDSLRVSSVEMNPPLDDFIHGICLGPKNEIGNHDSYFIVGSTYGTMPAGTLQDEITTNILSGKSKKSMDGNRIDKLSAFVSKVESNEIVWTTQLYAVPESKTTLNGGKTEAFGCHLIESDPTTMYVGGNVYEGGVMDSKFESAGGDDVWVAQIDTANGEPRWIKQVGSAGTDRISHTNGVQAALNGDCILYGETTGELYREKRKNEEDKYTSDVFVTTFGKNDGFTGPTIGSQDSTSKKSGTIIGVGTALVVVSLLMCAGVFYKFRRPTRRGASKNAKAGSDGIFSGNLAPEYHDDEDAQVTDAASNGASNGSTSGFSDNAPPPHVFQDDPKIAPEKSFV